jgi:hypothetical protein
VGFQNSATRPDLGFCAARSYSLMRPPRTVRAENLIRGSDQQSCSRCRPAVMITGHVPAIRSSC